MPVPAPPISRTTARATRLRIRVTANASPPNTAALAASTVDRFGTAWKVVRMVPKRYSLVTASTAMIIRTSTPNALIPTSALHAASPGDVAIGPVTEPITSATPSARTTTIATHQ
ncbi:hypothetical protein GORHZ_055_00450 [Gordonia rhizosphera NBRC 16068]|uniref:Uncharacterized protein n=1 Tax=Gordonia rhizosphera NBRC 16068 TaxID=1108045 RepID=K6W6D2_9ACTN|nr:hypothetical protein GORHZ_055_00450 [Gordonia rhizosphera NBRC 16068]